MTSITKLSLAVRGFIFDQIDIREVENFTENAGSFWIDLKDGRTFSVMIVECEKVKEEV